MGTPLSQGGAGKPRQGAIDYCAHWQPVIQAQHEGRLDFNVLPAHDIPAMLAFTKS
jgi:hypothetical protein